MKKELIILQALAVLVCACSEKNNTTSDKLSEDIVTEISVMVPDIVLPEEVKSSLNTGGLGGFSWWTTDNIGFWPAPTSVHFQDDIQQVIFYPQTAAKNSNFAANGWGLMRGRTYYSYYPYDQSATASKVTIDYASQSQTANDNSDHLGTCDYLHSSVSVPAEGSIPSMTYSHLGCIAKFVLTLQDFASPASIAFKSLTLAAPSNILVSSADYNPCTDAVNLTKTLTNSLTISLNGDTGFACNGSNQIIVYAMMSPSGWKDQTITATLTDVNGTSYSGTFTPKNNQSAGGGYQYAANISGGSPGPGPTPTPAPDDGYFDLTNGGAELANCYIVTSSSHSSHPSGKFAFRTKIGDTAFDSDAKTAELIWETNNTSSAEGVNFISEVHYKNGYVNFTVPKWATGNSGVAIKDEGETILWSWHIWFVGSCGETVYSSGTTMDRNLGACSTYNDRNWNVGGVDQMGFLYQWGRKDPFLGYTGDSGVLEQASTAGEHPTADGYRSVEYSIQNPRTYIEGDGKRWNSQENSFDLWSSTKTIYDPCPYGYKVPDKALFVPFRLHDDSDPRGGWVNDLDGHDSAWFITGRRLATGLDYPLTNYWSNNAYYDKSVQVQGEVANTINAWGNNEQDPNSISYCAEGNPVRCQKIQ